MIIKKCLTRWKPFLFILLIILSNTGCRSNKDTGPEPSVVSAEESLKHFRMEDGMEARLVASEPLVQAPVAMSFDEKGRLWVVEMMGYMPDTAGTAQYTNPNGKIVILEDKDGDGIMDSRKVFMDSLVLPRSISFYEDGVLIAVPSDLWFVKIRDDRPGERYLVDSAYTDGGSVEHQPNGLLRGLDNWFYNAKSDARYRRVNGQWVRERTHFRGQWGITQDDYGRLFYNNNSMNLLGDYFLPGLGALNPDQRFVSGFNEVIVKDNRTYPVHATPGVNRGYAKGVLDDSLRLKSFTAACGPVIYRGDLLGDEFNGNAFVAEPAANLIKRNKLKKDGFKVSGVQAYEGKEFLASDDERFRPVNLYNGPDGALYIVDMYRGIIQDVNFITAYLKNHISGLDLQKPLNRGRIYKIVPKGKKTKAPVLNDKSGDELVELLGHPDSWVRETAQRLIVDRKMFQTEGILRKKVTTDGPLLGRIHSFWALEGLNKLNDDDIEQFLYSDDIELNRQAVACVVEMLNRKNVQRWLKVIFEKMGTPTVGIVPYMAFFAARAMQYDPRDAEMALLKLAKQYPNDIYVADAIISGLYRGESSFFDKTRVDLPDTSSVIYKRLTGVLADMKLRENEASDPGKTKFKGGKALYGVYCKACHGDDGNGIKGLGAPLNGSEWVTGDKEKLSAIVLYGLSGPVEVGKKIYKEPEVGGEMPGFADNKDMNNSDLAQILSYIRSAWGNRADEVLPLEVNEARNKYGNRKESFTADQLRKEEK